MNTFQIGPDRNAFDKIRKQIATYEAGYMRYMSAYLSIRAEVAKCAHERHTLKTYLHTNPDAPAVIRRVLGSSTVGSYSLTELRMRTAQGALENASTYLPKLYNCKGKLNVKTPVYSLEQLTEEFAHLQLSFEIHDDDLHCIVPAGLKARLLAINEAPDNYTYKGNLEKDHFVELPAINIIIPSCPNKEITLLPTNDTDGYDNNFSDRAIHPHCMGDNSPCLGDFAAPIAEAYEAGDVSMIILLILEFLQTINCADTAGQSWVGLWLAPFDEGEYDYEHDRFHIDLNKRTVTVDKRSRSDEDEDEDEGEHEWDHAEDDD